jgi:hypothetical protein
MEHTPLSRDLEELLREQGADGGLTINQMLARTGGRGVFLLMILFALPFFTPMPLIGLSNLLGTIIAILAIRLALKKPPRLPRSIGERQFQPRRMERFLKAALWVVRRIEKVIKPRRTGWMKWPAARAVNASVIAFMGVMLALPLPPVIPFSNSFPAYAIIVLAASTMEEDGITIWVGYALALGTVIYLALFAGVVIGFFVKYYEQIKAWLLALL